MGYVKLLNYVEFLQHSNFQFRTDRSCTEGFCGIIYYSIIANIEFDLFCKNSISWLFMQWNKVKQGNEPHSPFFCLFYCPSNKEYVGM